MDTLNVDNTNVKVVDDLVIYEDKFLNRSKYFLCSEKRQRYVKLTYEQYVFYSNILKVFDGLHSEDDITKYLDEYTNGKITSHDVISVLDRYNLLETSNHEVTTKVEIELSSRKLLEFRLEKVQEKCKNVFNLIYYAICLISIIAILHTIGLLVFNQQDFNLLQDGANGFSWSDVGIGDFFCIIGFMWLSTTIHEMGHLLMANHHNIKWKTITVGLLWGINPIYYIKYYNMYMHPSKVRIKVLLSGMFLNIVQACIAFNILYYTDNWYAVVIIIINIGTFISTLLPLGTTDGYHVVTIILGQEGIRWKTLTGISKMIKNPGYIKDFIHSKTNVVMLCYIIISYTFGLLGCYQVIKSVIQYFGIFHINSKYIILGVSIIGGLIVLTYIRKLYKRLRNL